MKWADLNRQQKGRYAEYFVKMEFTQHGFDTYSAEVDNRGIDLVIRKEMNDRIKYFDVQVKSAQLGKYIFFSKDKFSLRDGLLAAIVIFSEGNAPKLYLIPSFLWLKPDGVLFRDRKYEGKKSKPEWGLSLAKKKRRLLENFTFEKTVKTLGGEEG